jgi:hypothetical protein
MDTTTLLILGVLALAIVVAGLWALNRSWGNFPNRAGTLPPPGSSAPGMSSRSREPEYRAEAAVPAVPAVPAASTPAPAGLVPIENPMVRRAAESALQRGGAARYIVRDGDRLYFAFDQIADPAQRQAAYDLMRRFNAGEDVDIRAMMQLVRQMFEP